MCEYVCLYFLRLQRKYQRAPLILELERGIEWRTNV